VWLESSFLIPSTQMSNRRIIVVCIHFCQTCLQLLFSAGNSTVDTTNNQPGRQAQMIFDWNREKNKTKIWERFLFYFLPTANERGKKSRRIIIIIIIRTRLLILRGVGSWWWVLLLVGWKEEKKTTMMTIRNGCHIL
jgi:hypothetical protein